MSKKTQMKLSPIQQLVKKVIIIKLKKAGFSVGDIAAIMSTHQSNVSRVNDDIQADTLEKVIIGK